MEKMKNLVLLLVLFLSLAACVNDPVRIIYEENASEQINLAAKELRRYIYQCTGAMPILSPVTATAEGIQPHSILLKEEPLGEEEFHILPAGEQSLIISGGSPLAILYGVYRYIEEYGVRYYLHGDVIPDKRQSLIIPEEAIMEKPLFRIRGILPFHDFPEGPDWWDADDYKAYFSQMVKMRMNFFGLHTYPDHSNGPEPTTWIGLPEDVLSGGKVKFGHKAKYSNTTKDFSWGYYPKKTSNYYYGGGNIFEHDNYSTELMVPYMSSEINEDVFNGKEEVDWPDYSPEQWAELFNEAGYFFNDVFSFAKQHGIKTCIGTETPITIPDEVKVRLAELGMEPGSPENIKKIYKGIFTRISRAYSLDYYWVWTPESWIWGNSGEQLEKTREDMLLALEAIEELGNPFSLATCGWVLGPAEDRSMFEDILPKNMPMSCINNYVGFYPVDPGFAKIQGRDLWAIPWLEDDPGLIAPQFWAGRMRRDAADALAYGCTGLIGIHWRTRVLGHNVSALARAGWQQDWNKEKEKRFGFEEALMNSQTPPRDAPVDDFYADWVETQFGYVRDDALAKIFTAIDGGEIYNWRAISSNIPRNSNWDHGPGGVIKDTLTWEQRKGSYEFIDHLEEYRPKIEGKGNIARFDYWLNTLKYHRAIGKFSCTLGKITHLEEEMDKTADKLALIEKKWIPLRVQLVNDFEEMNLYLLKTITTKGAMGTLANLNQHVAYLYFDQPAGIIASKIGEKLPENCWPLKKDLNTPRIFMPTVRSVLNADEDLSLKCIVTGDAGEPVLYFRKLGEKRFQEKQMEHLERGVYKVILSPDEMKGDIEYYIRSSNNLYYPPSAPELCQSVVIRDAFLH